MNHGDPQAPAQGDVTLLLQKYAEGEKDALDNLFPLVYAELRRIASGQRRKRLGSETLQTTALIHEAYLRFARRDSAQYEHREHFYAVAAKAMRQILLDEARRRMRLKRGGEARRDSMDPNDLEVEQQAEFLIALDQGLSRLGKIRDRARRVVEYRYFGGLTEEETARVIGVDARTVRRDWATARTWLAMELKLTVEDGVTASMSLGSGV